MKKTVLILFLASNLIFPLSYAEVDGVVAICETEALNAGLDGAEADKYVEECVQNASQGETSMDNAQGNTNVTE